VLTAAPLRPASYAMDGVVQVLVLQALAVLLFFAVLVLLAAESRSGLNGAGWAALASASLSLCGTAWLVGRTLGSASTQEPGP